MLLANQCAAQRRPHQQGSLCLPLYTRLRCREDGKAVRHTAGLRPERAKFKNPIPTQLGWLPCWTRLATSPFKLLQHRHPAQYAEGPLRPQPLGHYGLVLADYAHFTSPIRRYPDLAIHRILSEMLTGASASQLQKDFNEFAQQASEKSSKQEVAAVRIERDVEDLYKAEYMHSHLGEVHTGTVRGITRAAFLSSWTIPVEGFVPAAQLCKGRGLQVIDGVSMLDPDRQKLDAGSSMMIQVAAADVALGRIDFEYMVE